MAVAQQQADPVIMTINGQPVTRSEFEYSYNKNNTQGVVDKKTVNEYVDLFINYKLKVLAAKAAKLDTTSSFKKEFAMYCNQQIRPTFITNADIEKRAKEIYKETQQRVDGAGGLVKPAHILIALRQTATEEQRQMAEHKADSIYQLLLHGANFAQLAKQYSDDKASALKGGELPWLERRQTLKEFDDAIFSMKKGELHQPVLSPAGYHIILLKNKRNFFPYDSLHANILQYIEMRGIREQIISQKIDSMVQTSTADVTQQQVLDKRKDELAKNDEQLKYLIQEYHDGLLLFEISNKKVWEKAKADKNALKHFFKKNKKKYKWDAPRFKGIAYLCKNKYDIKGVKQVLKHLPFDQWTEKLHTAFNNDSVRIKVVKGIFKRSINPVVDRLVFKQQIKKNTNLKYPYEAVYGKKIRTPQTYEDVKELVIADYQDLLEKEWIKELRKQYVVKVNQDVLTTVNKH